MEAVTETLKFGWDFIDAIVTWGDKAPAPCFGGTISMYTCTSFLFFMVRDFLMSEITRR